jgi:hypothetical protein
LPWSCPFRPPRGIGFVRSACFAAARQWSAYALFAAGGVSNNKSVRGRARSNATKVVGLINVGLSPFLFWWNRIPGNPLFGLMVDASMLGGLVFLFLLNGLINRLASMLPDETLRQNETLHGDQPGISCSRSCFCSRLTS